MAAPSATRERPDQALVYAALVIVAGVLATTLAQTQVLARLPLQNLLKNDGHFYSVPYRLVHRRLDVFLTATAVAIFHQVGPMPHQRL